jgi:hypothetical protein
MGAIPAFEFPTELISEIPKAAASNGIELEVLHKVERDIFAQYVFRRRLGTIVGHSRTTESVHYLWLAFPWSHAFNPFVWPFNFHLSSRIERMLQDLGAQRCGVEKCWEDSTH